MTFVLQTQIKTAQQAIRQLKSKRDKLQDEMNQAMPVEIQALQGALNVRQCLIDKESG